jgi:hypothetical protein
METLQIIGSYLFWVFVVSTVIGVTVALTEQIIVLWNTYKK